MTLQIQVSDIAEGREFYTNLFGRDLDFAPHDDFLEWQVVDVRAAAAWVREELGVETDSDHDAP